MEWKYEFYFTLILRLIVCCVWTPPKNIRSCCYKLQDNRRGSEYHEQDCYKVFTITLHNNYCWLWRQCASRQENIQLFVTQSSHCIAINYSFPKLEWWNLPFNLKTTVTHFSQKCWFYGNLILKSTWIIWWKSPTAYQHVYGQMKSEKLWIRIEFNQFEGKNDNIYIQKVVQYLQIYAYVMMKCTMSYMTHYLQVRRWTKKTMLSWLSYVWCMIRVVVVCAWENTILVQILFIVSKEGYKSL